MLGPISHTNHSTLFNGSVLATLNPLDWVLVVALTISTVMAFLRGLIRSVIAMAGVVLGILLAAWYSPQATVWLDRWISQRAVAQVVAFAGIVVVCYLAAVLLGRILRGACQAGGLGIVDRLGGAAFGFARAILLISAVMIPAAPFVPLLPFARDSVLLPYLRTAAHGISFVLPRDFEDRLQVGAKLLHDPATAHGRRSTSFSPGTTARQRPLEGDAQ